MEIKYVKCIACKGKGVVKKLVRNKVSEKQKAEILKLYRKGHGIREIARIVKIKHPYSVQYAILTANN
jgi:transposase-like protein